jgi:hypothetical protein
MVSSTVAVWAMAPVFGGGMAPLLVSSATALVAVRIKSAEATPWSSFDAFIALTLLQILVMQKTALTEWLNMVY